MLPFGSRVASFFPLSSGDERLVAALQFYFLASVPTMHRPGDAPVAQQKPKRSPNPPGTHRAVPTPPKKKNPKKSGGDWRRPAPRSHIQTTPTVGARCAQPLAPRTDGPPRRPLCLGAFRHVLQSLPPTATVDLADEPPVVVMDAARLHASCVLFTCGMTTAERLLQRLGIAGPFDDLPTVRVRASAPPACTAQAPFGGVRLCRPKAERAAQSSGAARSPPTAHDVCCEVILDRARAAYREAGAAGAVDAVADVSSVLASTAPVDVVLYACGTTLVTRRVALGMLTLGESRSDVDAVYACAAWAVLPHGSVAVHERRS